MSRPGSSYCGPLAAEPSYRYCKHLPRKQPIRCTNKHSFFGLLVAHRRRPTRAKRRATRGTPFRAGERRSPKCTFGRPTHSLLLSSCEFQCRLVGRVLSLLLLAGSLAKRQTRLSHLQQFRVPHQHAWRLSAIPQPWPPVSHWGTPLKCLATRRCQPPPYTRGLALEARCPQT